ncbi:MAG: hypothetical protein GY875_14485 [Gammaproteobacteria bacterium]|nr:hypothetical protein [Gammaproteobacteria bacterium]
MYVVEFTNLEQQRIGREAAAMLASKLAERTAFIDAHAASKAECADSKHDGWLLKVELNRRDPEATGDLHDVGFHLQLDRPGGELAAKMFWTLFRKAGAELDVAFKVPGFIRDLKDSVGGDGADFDLLVAKLLVKLPIESVASFNKDPTFGPFWRIESHTHEQLCMREGSELIVKSKLSGSNRKVITEVVEPDDWQEKIRSEPTEQKMITTLNELSQNQVQVMAIYVGRYVLLTNCTPPRRKNRACEEDRHAPNEANAHDQCGFGRVAADHLHDASPGGA